MANPSAYSISYRHTRPGTANLYNPNWPAGQFHPARNNVLKNKTITFLLKFEFILTLKTMLLVLVKTVLLVFFY